MKLNNINFHSARVGQLPRSYYLSRAVLYFPVVHIYGSTYIRWPHFKLTKKARLTLPKTCTNISPLALFPFCVKPWLWANAACFDFLLFSVVLFSFSYHSFYQWFLLLYIMVPPLIPNQLFFPTLGPTVTKVSLTLLNVLSDLYFVNGYKLKENIHSELKHKSYRRSNAALYVSCMEMNLTLNYVISSSKIHSWFKSRTRS